MSDTALARRLAERSRRPRLADEVVTAGRHPERLPARVVAEGAQVVEAGRCPPCLAATAAGGLAGACAGPRFDTDVGRATRYRTRTVPASPKRPTRPSPCGGRAPCCT